MPDYRCCVGSFVRANATGFQTVSGVADASGSFTPRFLLFFTSQQSIDGFTTDAHVTLHGIFPEQGGNAARGQSTTLIDNGGALRAAQNVGAAFSSFWDSVSVPNNSANWVSAAVGSFTINWIIVDGGRPCSIFYVALGGADFEAQVGSIQANFPGFYPVTGLGFPPSGILTLTVVTQGGAQTYIAGVSVDNMPTFGGATATDEGASCGGAKGGIFAFLARQQRTDRCVLMYSDTQPEYRSQATLSSMDADGFTLEWTEANNVFLPNAYKDPGAYWMAFGGALPIAMGSIIQPSTPGSQDVTLSGPPGAVLFWSANGPSSSSPITGSQKFSFGAVDAQGHQFSTWFGTNTPGGFAAMRARSSTRAITLANITGPPAASTLTGAATVTITDTGFTVDWATVDGVAREVLWYAFGVSTVTPPPPPPPPTQVCEVGHGSCEPNVVGSRTGM